MITIYKWENGGLKEALEFAPSCWINLESPTTTEIDRVVEFSKVPRDFLTDPLDSDERPRFDYDDNSSLLIIHVPCIVETDDVVPYRTIPLGIVFFGKSVITVSNARTPVTSAFLDQIRRVCPPSDQYRFAFRLIWHGGVLFLRYLNDVHQRTNSFEEELHESISNDVLLKLLTIEKTLVYFTTSLKADTIALARSKTTRQLVLSEDDSDQLEDAMVEYQQALETATIHANILNGTLDTFASLINNNLNNVMKYLTVVTIFLAVPTLITSAYGMNVKLPLVEGGGNARVFWILAVFAGLATGLIALVLFILSKKRKF